MSLAIITLQNWHFIQTCTDGRFVCFFGLIVPLENFSLIWRRHHYRWRASNFDLCSALMAFFSVPHLLWHGASVYNGHFRGPVTFTCTYCRALGSAAVTTCFYDLVLSRLGFEHQTFRLRGQRSNPLRHRRGPTVKTWFSFTTAILPICC